MIPLPVNMALYSLQNPLSIWSLLYSDVIIAVPKHDLYSMFTKIELHSYCNYIMASIPPKYKIVLVGDAGTGKTSIINRFIHDEFEDTYEVTHLYIFRSQKNRI